MRGMICSIYTNKELGNCSNKGLSYFYDKVTLIGEGIPEIFAPSEDAPAVFLITNHPVPIVVPYDYRDRWKGRLMFGGDFIHSSDSRFPDDCPIKLFDRSESGPVCEPPRYADPKHDKDRPVLRQLGKLLDAMDDLDHRLLDGRLPYDLQRLHREITDKLRIDGYSVSPEGTNNWHVRRSN